MNENFSSFNTPPDNLTFQWSNNAWGLASHSAGGLWDVNHATVHHSLWAHNHTRNPKARPDGPLDDTVPANRPITVEDLLTFRLGLGLVLAPPGTYPIQRAIADLDLVGTEARIRMAARLDRAVLEARFPERFVREEGAAFDARLRGMGDHEAASAPGCTTGASGRVPSSRQGLAIRLMTSMRRPSTPRENQKCRTSSNSASTSTAVPNTTSSGRRAPIHSATRAPLGHLMTGRSL